MEPKVLVATPTCDKFDYCTSQYIKAIKALDYSNFDVLLVDNSKTLDFFNKIKNIFPSIHVDPANKPIETLVKCKNIIRDKVLKENYDYYLNIDYDVIIPPNTIKQLLSHNKKIITGVYYKKFTLQPQNKEVIWPVIYKDVPGLPDKMHLCTDLEVASPKLIEIKASGSGCFLIHREVLEKIKFRNTETTADDLLYCFDARDKGYKVFCDTSVKCKHLINKPN